MKQKTTYEQDKNGKNPKWKEVSILIGAICLFIAIISLVLPGSVPDTGDPVCYQCTMQDKPRLIAEQITDQGYTLYVYGGCHWCDEQLSEFGDSATHLAVIDCGIAHQAYRFENISEAEAAYNWLSLNGSLIKITNLTYENLTIEYDGYGILGYANKNAECAALNISGYPTWIAPNGTHIVGFRSLDAIGGWLH